MTDIDRYLTPQRLAELRTTADNANYVVLLKRVDALALLDAADALPDIIRQAKAEALREAANDIERRINAPDLIQLADKYGGFHAGERYRAQREVYLLRARADRIEQGAAS